MNDLLEALSILAKYWSPDTTPCPTHCEHDVMYVLIDPAAVPDADRSRLEELGFIADRKEHHFYSYRFGSA